MLWTPTPDYRIYPDKGYISVTSYTDKWPKGERFEDYLLDNTREQAAKKLREAGERGTRVHEVIEYILNGTKYTLEDYVKNFFSYDPERGYREWKKYVEPFYHWYTDFGFPAPIATEIRCHSDHLKTAGTIDTIFNISGRLAIIDWKTSADIHMGHKIQQAVYWHCAEDDGSIKIENCGLVRLGAQFKTVKELKSLDDRHTGIGYEYVPVTQAERPGLIKKFKVCQEIFHEEHGDDAATIEPVELMDFIQISNPIKK